MEVTNYSVGRVLLKMVILLNTISNSNLMIAMTIIEFLLKKQLVDGLIKVVEK